MIILTQSSERVAKQIDFLLEALIDAVGLRAPPCKMALLATVVTSFVAHVPVTLTPYLGIRPTSPTLSGLLRSTALHAILRVPVATTAETLKFPLEL